MQEGPAAGTVALSGALCTGKTTLARALSLIPGATMVAAREVLQRAAAAEMSRAQLQEFGRELESQTGGQWLAEAMDNAPKGQLVIVDAVRTSRQVRAIGQRLTERPVLVHLLADRPTRSRRFMGRKHAESVDAAAEFSVISDDPLERAVDDLASKAELVVDTTHLSTQEVFRVVDAFLARRLTARGRCPENL